MPSARVGIHAAAGSEPPSRGLWLDAGVAASADLQQHFGTRVVAWRPTRHDDAPPAALRPVNGQITNAGNWRTAAQGRPGANFNSSTNMSWDAGAPTVDVFGPLTVYVAFTTPTTFQFTFVTLETTAVGPTSRLSLFLNQTPSLFWSPASGAGRSLDLEGVADWSTTPGATRVLAVSVPALGTSGTARWYAGADRWVRRTEAGATRTVPASDAYRLGMSGEGGTNTAWIHEVRLITAEHPEWALARTHAALVNKWGAVAS